MRFFIVAVVACLSAQAGFDPSVTVTGKVINMSKDHLEIQSAEGQRFMVPRPNQGQLSRLRPGVIVRVRADIQDIVKANQNRR